MDINAIVSFLAGIGFGSVVASSVQHFLTRHSKRQDQIEGELREAFYGLLESLRELETRDSMENKKKLGYWIARIQIVGSNKVNTAVRSWIQTKSGTAERIDAMEFMVATMRSDLKIKE